MLRQSACATSELSRSYRGHLRSLTRFGRRGGCCHAICFAVWTCAVCRGSVESCGNDRLVSTCDKSPLILSIRRTLPPPEPGKSPVPRRFAGRSIQNRSPQLISPDEFCLNCGQHQAGTNEYPGRSESRRPCVVDDRQQAGLNIVRYQRAIGPGTVLRPLILTGNPNSCEKSVDVFSQSCIPTRNTLTRTTESLHYGGCCRIPRSHQHRTSCPGLHRFSQTTSSATPNRF